ncbi:MAG TPA: ATP-binding protein [Nevskiaceae bacterium]|nr:ATP-binding protein [Nevskiaceae bacterium]
MATKYPSIPNISMFRSARLQLTLFYLAILLLFSLTLTVSIRFLAEREYARSNDVQRSEIERLLPERLVIALSPRPDVAFSNLQDDQAELVRRHLNHELMLINLWALGIGGLLSYWFAGRTLRPIEEAHETQARFAADASHELRTPLTNMKLENEVFLRQKDFSKDEARELIHSNLEEVQRLENLSTSLLDLTRYDNAALTLTPVAIKPIIAQAVRQMDKTAAAKKAVIIQDVAAAKVLAHADSQAQLLDILLDNAVKYGPEKGKVVVAGRRHSGQYVVTVTDEGPGIATEDLPFIFDRLYRGDKARSGTVQGYGLGLSLAKKIAAANQAGITAHNTPKGGARFELRLNLAR